MTNSTNRGSGALCYMLGPSVGDVPEMDSQGVPTEVIRAIKAERGTVIYYPVPWLRPDFRAAWGVP